MRTAILIFLLGSAAFAQPVVKRPCRSASDVNCTNQVNQDGSQFPTAGGGGAANAYRSGLIAGPDSTKTITLAAHGFTTSAFVVKATDNASPRATLQIWNEWDPITYDITIHFAVPASNYYVVIMASGTGPAGATGAAGAAGATGPAGPSGAVSVAGTTNQVNVSCVANVCTFSLPTAGLYFQDIAPGNLGDFTITQGPGIVPFRSKSTLPINNSLVINNGKIGIRNDTPTAYFHLPPSTAAANTASLKIDAGTVATTPVSGNFESSGTHLYWTDSTPTRWQLDQQSGTSVNVNGSSVSSPNFNATTPAAESGYINAKLQVSSSSVSIEIPLSFPGPSMTPQVIDCHTACSPTAAQLSNAEVANYGQAASSIAITGPTLAAGMNFIMIAGTAQAANYWQYTSTTANVYLDAAGPYTTVGFATPAVGNSISCFSFQTGASTYSLRCVTLNGTSSGS